MANREDLQEKFRQLIVPLMHMSLHDNPTDVTLYCSRYFQALLEERQRSSISANENNNLQQSKSIQTGGKVERRESLPHAQESTSLPILTEVHRDKLSIRETSSWNSPSDSSSKSCRFRHLSYDVADAMSSIGDQPNSPAFEVASENSNVKGPDIELFGGDEGSKSLEKDSENYETGADPCTLKPNERPLMDDYDVSLFDNVIEDELTAIVNLVSTSAEATSKANFRKKWSTNVHSKFPLEIESKYPEDNDDEEEFTMNVNCPLDETVETWGSTSDNAAFIPIPQLKKLAQLANVKNSPEDRKKDEMVDTYINNSPSTSSGIIPQLRMENVEKIPSFIRKEIENSVKSLNQYLQELIKVLEETKSFCNENIQKTLPSKVLPVKPQPAPRKKRSVTTVSSSENLFQSVEFLSGSDNEPTSSETDKGCSKLSKTFLKSKSNGYEINSLGSDHNLKGKKIEEEYAKNEMNKHIEGSDAGSSSKKSSLDQNMGRNDTHFKEVKRSDSKDIGTNDKYRSNKGIVNKGFVKDDDELLRKSHRHGQLHHHGQNSWEDNDYRQIMFDEPSAFSQIRISRPCPRRIGNLTRPHNQVNRQMFSFRPGSGFSNVGEGGDVFGTRRRQCSVATETEPMQTTNRAGSLDARIRTIRINSFVDGNAGQETSAFKNVNGKIGSHISEKELDNQKSSQSNDKSSTLNEEFPTQSVSAKVESTAVMGEKVEAQDIKIDIKPTKKSSSLNPCAESFNPTSKLVQVSEALKSFGGNETMKQEERSYKSTNIPADRSVVRFPVVDADELWDYEMFENDFPQQDQEPILYQDADSEEHVTLEEIEDQHNCRNAVCATGSDMSDPISYPYQENGVLYDSAPPGEKNSHSKKREDSKKCTSDTKLAEGDQKLKAAKERSERSDLSTKQEEPGLSSACGDFVASENNNDGEENSGNDSENVQVVAAPGSIALDAGIPGIPPLVDDRNSLQNRIRQEEEMELNFACFSGSDSSEVDSSEMSEDENEFSGGSDETKLEEVP